MGKLILDLSEYEEAQLRKAAAESGVPVSRWVARLIQEQTPDHWPESVRQLAGQWSDFPDPDELRNPSSS